MAHEYLDVLEHVPAPPSKQPEVVGELEAFCADIEAFKQGKLRCFLASGATTNWGQEWRPTLKSVLKGYEHVLLRAYVPVSGLPVKLDLYDRDVIECKDVEELKAALKQFLRRPNVRETIEVYSR